MIVIIQMRPRRRLSVTTKATISKAATPIPDPTMAKPALLWIIAGLTALVLAGSAVASPLMYSYDSMTPITETMTESGVTLILDKSLLHTRVLRLVETLNVGSADLKPASEGELGRGGLGALVGPELHEHDLYEILKKDDGRALSNALCPGSDKAWLAFGPIKQDRELKVRALGREAKTGKAWLCLTLDYAFHGVWAMPPVDLPQPDRSDPFEQSPANTRY